MIRMRQITGVFATEKYLPEPRIPVAGALLRLRGDLADFGRVAIDAAPYLLNHDRGAVVGKIAQAWYDVREGCRFVADLPIDEQEPIERVVQYLREFDQGIRGLFSPGYRITDIEPAGRSAAGNPMFDGAWMLSEISDMTVPADTDARADAYRGLTDDRVWNLMGLKAVDDQDPEGLVSLRGIGHGAIAMDVIERVARNSNDINIKDALIKALRARRQS